MSSNKSLAELLIVASSKLPCLLVFLYIFCGKLSESQQEVIKCLVSAGLFAYSHMEFEAERDQKASGDPSVAEMTAKALKILMKNPHGFFLFVESK